MHLFWWSRIPQKKQACDGNEMRAWLGSLRHQITPREHEYKPMNRADSPIRLDFTPRKAPLSIY
jgi:hypothetical protein